MFGAKQTFLILPRHPQDGWTDMRKTVGVCGIAEPIDKWLTVGGWENPVIIAETPYSLLIHCMQLEELS